MWNYTDKVMDHFLHPRNAGEMEKPSAVGEVGNISCGDAMKLFLKIENNVVVDAKFQTFGCASAIASASALTELVKGKPVAEAEKVTNQDIANYLGELPEAKMHCSVMGMEAMQAALSQWRGESDGKHLEAHDEHGAAAASPYTAPGQDKIVCYCFGVTEAKIRTVVAANHLKEVDDVTHYCKAGGACGGCKGKIQEILDDMLQQRVARGATAAAGANLPAPMTNLQKMMKIQQVIDTVIRPGLQADGGDIELVDVDGANISVRLKGRCAGCPGAHMTLKRWVEAQLREKVLAGLNVIDVP